jgi:predicted RNase H-like HicB family nuclease
MTVIIDIQELEVGIIRASCLTLPGCVGYGATREEACQEMGTAIRRYFADVQYVPMAYFGGETTRPWN